MGEYKSKGYVSIHREIMDHWLWDKKPFSYGQAWIDLIMLANYKNEKFLTKDKKLINGERGVVYRSIKSLTERWGWKSRDKTRHFLSLLESDGMVRVNSTTHGSTVTIVNYEKFQNQVLTKRQQNDIKTTTKPQQNDTYNKDNKENKGNNPPLYSPQRGELPDGRDFDPFDERNNDWFSGGYRVDDDGKWVKVE